MRAYEVYLVLRWYDLMEGVPFRYVRGDVPGIPLRHFFEAWVRQSWATRTYVCHLN